MGAPAVIPDAEFAKLYEWAVGFAERRAHGFATASEDLLDAATSGLLWARDHCKSVGEWDRFARASVRQAVARAYAKCARRAKHRPTMEALDVERDPPTSEAEAAPLLIADLPEELAVAVRFFMVDGFTLRDCGLLLGVSQNTVKRRLVQAAELLAPGRIRPVRRRGEKRLRCG